MSDLALYQALQPALTDLIYEIRQLRSDIMTAREDVQTITTQLGKAKDEILAKLADLQTAIDNGTVTADDLQPLRDTVQALDDVVPDPTVTAQPAEGTTDEANK